MPYDIMHTFAERGIYMEVGSMKLKRGQKVRVREFDGNILERIVVADKDARIVICCEQEWEEAASSGRQPEGIAFPRGDVYQ
jgi:hypothetical protein